MRFKYYLRGIGIGITLATLLLTVSFYFGRDYLYNKQLSDEEIIEKASALGMVMPEEEVSPEAEDDVVVEEENISADSSIQETDETTATEAEQESTTEEMSTEAVEADLESKDDSTVTYVPFTVRGGESSEVVCTHLKNAGLIDDSDAFNKYLHKCKVDNLIQNGTFYVKQGSTYDDLIAVLVNKEVRTTTPPKN
jgi:hypothetical protein